MTSHARKGTVYLIGAGPGDPELLTLKAARLLAECDVVLHDDLVPEELLAVVSRRALVTSVGKRCGRPRMTQAEINELMVDSARKNLSVARLKSGDPLIFGRAGEELQALREAGVRFEVVPGVTAAAAAAASLGVSLTDRRFASKLVFASGHHAAGKNQAMPVFAEAPPRDATLLVYMPGRDLRRIARELREAGVPEDVACCAISHAATARQSWVAGTVVGLETMECGPAPVLLLVGRAMASLLAGDADGVVREVVGDAVVELGLQE